MLGTRLTFFKVLNMVVPDSLQEIGMSISWRSATIAAHVCANKGHRVDITVDMKGTINGAAVCVQCGLTLEEIRNGKVLIPQKEQQEQKES
mgnify:CR=1 FL=1